MANPELGTKRSCPKCASKFYDLKKHPAECPVCGHSFDPEAPVKKRGKRKTVKMAAGDVKDKVIAAQAATNKKRKDAEDDDDIELPEFEDLGIIEDMDDLDDMEDVAVVKKKGDDDDDAYIDDDDAIIADEDLDEDDDDDDSKS